MRLVDADEIKKNFDAETWQGEMMIAIADTLPTVEALPVVHGKWVYNDFIKEWECSECHSSISLGDDRNGHPNFCPQCGAMMKRKKTVQVDCDLDEIVRIINSSVLSEDAAVSYSKSYSKSYSLGKKV